VPAGSTALREGASSNSKGDNQVKRTLVILGTCAVLSTASVNALAHGDEAGAAILGGVVGGLIGSAIVGYPAYSVYSPAPVVVEPYAPPPVVVERYYEPAPVVVERYGPPRVIYYSTGGHHWRGYRYHRRWHGHD
jgi:hypothetical protein